MEFFEAVKRGVEEFIKIKDRPVRIIGHLDSDGLTSMAILIKTFKRADVKFSALNHLSLPSRITKIVCSSL